MLLMKIKAQGFTHFPQEKAKRWGFTQYKFLLHDTRVSKNKIKTTPRTSCFSLG